MQVVITTWHWVRLGELNKNTNMFVKLGDKFVLDHIINNYIEQDVEILFTINIRGIM